MYNMLNCSNLGDYHDVYLQIDVFLLCDIFEKFRKVCMNVYRLDPAYFYSAPNLSWDAMLISTNVELGLIKDIDMLLFCETAIRGGLNGVGSLRFFRANNSYLNAEYNVETQPTVFGAFFDVTSLYAGTMTKKLPIGNYEWVEDFDTAKILSHDSSESVGYFVEVDLEYPTELHDCHQDLPLAPEKLVIERNWLSPYSKKIASTNTSVKVPKLVETLFDKQHYICHVENLKFYVNHGLRVAKIHRVLKFDQSEWLAPYIEKNTVMRKNAESNFEKNFYKLMSNACFGKTMENLRNRREIKFVSSQVEAVRQTCKPTFKSFQIISPNLTSVSFTQPIVHWTKPTAVGASILELSKLTLYGFHYDQMKPRYGSNVNVVYKDTDSLLYRIQTDDLYADMQSFKHLLDLSDYPKEHPLFDPTNKKVPLTMTDELNGKVFKECVVLRSKLYSIMFEDGVKQSAKSVQKSVKKTLHHEKYKNCLLDQKPLRAQMRQLHSINHQIRIKAVNKVALSCFDDKRYILEDGITTLPHGHYTLNQTRQSNLRDNDDDDVHHHHRQFASPDDDPDNITATTTTTTTAEQQTSSDSDDDEEDQSSAEVSSSYSSSLQQRIMGGVDQDGWYGKWCRFAASCKELFFLINLLLLVLVAPDPGFYQRQHHDDDDIVSWQSMRGEDDDQESDNERRRRRKNPFIDDEAVECSDDEAAVESSSSSSGTSSIVIKTKRQKTHLIWTYSSSDDSDE